jgi:hypothetical protein
MKALASGLLLLVFHGASFAQFSIVDECKSASNTAEDYVACRAHEAIELPYMVHATCFDARVPAEAKFKVTIDVGSTGIVTNVAIAETNIVSPAFRDRAIESLYKMRIGTLPNPVSLANASLELNLKEISKRIRIYDCKAFRARATP